MNSRARGEKVGHLGRHVPPTELAGICHHGGSVKSQRGADVLAVRCRGAERVEVGGVGEHVAPPRRGLPRRRAADPFRKHDDARRAADSPPARGWAGSSYDVTSLPGRERWVDPWHLSPLAFDPSVVFIGRVPGGSSQDRTSEGDTHA